MSKHEKHLKRERRKADRRRRSSAATHGAAALAAAAAIAAGTSAYANPIRYDNTAGFDWNASAGHAVLDITADSFGQPGSGGGAGTFERCTKYYGSDVRAGDGGKLLGWNGYVSSMLVGLNAGETIPATGFIWGDARYIYNDYAGYEQACFPESEAHYLAVRFDVGPGWQYGWIGVVRTGYELDAFAWGYETEVGVPIAAGVPEPGTLALLAVGAVGVLRRRR